MKVIVLIIVFAVGTIFLFFKKEDTVENIKTEEIIKKTAQRRRKSREKETKIQTAC